LKKLIIKGMDRRYFSDKIVEWYLENKRELPWRATTDPYKIWLSEIILQQTRVVQGLPYYERFVKKYPKIKLLADASEQDVLRLWQGLGYYSRARNLHKCAKSVSGTSNGKFPSTFSELKLLPGIGDYTAAAIASIAFNEPVAVVDGNVFRVLARLHGIDTPINSTAGRKYFTELANSLISEKHPALHNQAMMEFGATFCTPVNPSCDNCIFRKPCVAQKHNLQASLPVKNKTLKVRKRYFHYLVIKKGKSLLMRKREGKDIWLGLYDFPLVENEKALKPEKVLEADLSDLKPLLKSPLSIAVTESYKHVLTHQTIFCRFVVIDQKKMPFKEQKSMKFYTFDEIHELPKPALISRFLDEFAF
jgi:A/G-specific adenine glycosylase